MASARANRDSGPGLYRVDPAAFRSAVRAAMDRNGISEVVPPGMEGQQLLVLKSLVEDFGGEVTASALTRHISRRFRRTQPGLGPRLIDALQALNRAGALSLEANGETDFIVRLLPDGAEICA